MTCFINKEELTENFDKIIETLSDVVGIGLFARDFIG